MNTKTVFGLCAVSVLFSGPARAEDAPAPDVSAAPVSEAPLWFAGDDATVVQLVSRGFYDTWIRDRLTIGIGISYSTLTDAKRSADKFSNKTFVGFINELEDEDEVGFEPELSYWAADHVRLTLTWDGVSGRTRNYNKTQHSDGVVEAGGPAFLVEGLLSFLDDTLLLHAGAGVSWQFCDFKEDAWWHLGYSSESSWNTLGSSTTKVRGNHYREIRVDDAFGWLLSAGVAWRPAERLEFDLSVRHMWLEPDCEFGYRYRSKFEVHDTGDFTLDHLTAALTVSYVF